MARPSILDQPAVLWSVPYPWKKRPKDTAGQVGKTLGRIFTLGASSLKSGGDTLRSTAIGWRPPMGLGNERFVKAEQLATILGGMDTLIAAGVQPWVQLEGRIERLPPLQLQQNYAAEMQAVGIVHDAAKALGAKNAKTSLKSASEYVRAQVKKNKLAAAAWHARSIRLAVMGMGAQDKAAAITGATGLATAAAGKGLLMGAGPMAATVVGLPVAAVMGIAGGILGGVSAITTGASSVTSANKMRNQVLLDQSIADFNHALQLAGLRKQKRQLEQELAKAQAYNDSFLLSALPEGEARAKLIQTGALVGATGLTAFGLYLVYSRVRRT